MSHNVFSKYKLVMDYHFLGKTKKYEKHIYYSLKLSIKFLSHCYEYEMNFHLTCVFSQLKCKYLCRSFSSSIFFSFRSFFHTITAKSCLYTSAFYSLFIAYMHKLIFKTKFWRRSNFWVKMHSHCSRNVYEIIKLDFVIHSTISNAKSIIKSIQVCF